MKIHLIVFALLFAFSTSAVAANPGAPTQWDRGSAMAAATSVNVEQAAYDLGLIASLADGEATLEKLNQLETRSDWPLPAREAALYEFVRSLAGLPRAAVATGVMQHLQNYQAQTLVPHEDHGHTLVPLFNIRGAATGIEHGWQRSESAIEAGGLLETDPAALVSAFLESASPSQRSGYLDALAYTRLENVATVQDAALEKIDSTPELTPMLGRTSVITSDTFAIRRLLVNGRGAGLSAALGQLGQRLQATETADLLFFAVREAPAENAVLAIAAWWPRVSHATAVRDLLVDKLADPALGAAAALALAQSPDIQTIRMLQRTAKGDNSAARRAQLALDMNRDRLVSEVQQ